MVNAWKLAGISQAMTKGVTDLSLLDPFTSRHQLISSRDQVYNLALFIEKILLSSFSLTREVKDSESEWDNNTEQRSKVNIFDPLHDGNKPAVIHVDFFEKIADLFSVQRKNKLFSVQF